MKPSEILNIISQKLSESFPDMNVSVRSPFRDKVLTPALLLECEETSPESNMQGGDGRVWVEMRLSAKLAVADIDENQASFSMIDATTEISDFIHANTWGLENAKPAIWRGCLSEPFIKELDHVAYWSIGWDQSFLLGQPDPIQADYAEEVYLGITPKIGPASRDEYVRIK